MLLPLWPRLPVLPSPSEPARKQRSMCPRRPRPKKLLRSVAHAPHPGLPHLRFFGCHDASRSAPSLQSRRVVGPGLAGLGTQHTGCCTGVCGVRPAIEGVFEAVGRVASRWQLVQGKRGGAAYMCGPAHLCPPFSPYVLYILLASEHGKWIRSVSVLWLAGLCSLCGVHRIHCSDGARVRPATVVCDGGRRRGMHVCGISALHWSECEHVTLLFPVVSAGSVTASAPPAPCCVSASLAGTCQPAPASHGAHRQARPQGQWQEVS